MVKKFFILAVALATSAAFLTSCGDDDDAPAQITGKYTVTAKPESEPSSVGYKWLTEQIDSLSKVYTNLGADVNEASGKNDDACEALKKLSTAFEKYKETHDCGADSFKVAYKFETSNAEVTNSKEISFVYNSDGYERIISDSTITINASETFKGSKVAEEDLDFDIDNIKSAIAVESQEGVKVVKAESKAFYETDIFYDIKVQNKNKTKSYVNLSYKVERGQDDVFGKYYLIIPVELTDKNNEKSIVNYILNVEIK